MIREAFEGWKTEFRGQLNDMSASAYFRNIVTSPIAHLVTDCRERLEESAKQIMDKAEEAATRRVPRNVDQVCTILPFYSFVRLLTFSQSTWESSVRR